MSDLGARLNSIHQRIIEGSRSASLDLFRLALGPVTAQIIRSVSGVTAEEARDHAVTALIEYVNDQTGFDPEKSSLWTYLCMVASRNAIDAARQRVSRAVLLEKANYDIELWRVQPNNEYDEVEWRKDAQKIMELHGSYLARTDVERKVLTLMLDGERSVDLYAAAMGLPTDQDSSAEVKKVKDRIQLRMKKVRDEL